MFHIGQRVVCINDANWGWQWTEVRTPVKGGVYTVREVNEKHEGLLLVEITNAEQQFVDDFGEPGFLAHRFRPIDETRLSVFRAMLVTPPRELAPAGDEDERRKVNGWEAA